MPFKYNNLQMRKGIWVLCIDALFTEDQRLLIPNIPMLNEYYSIRQFNRTTNSVTDIHMYTILLNEVTNPKVRMITGKSSALVEPSFRVTRFAPVCSEDDLSGSVQAFYHILNTQSNGRSFS